MKWPLVTRAQYARLYACLERTEAALAAQRAKVVDLANTIDEFRASVERERDRYERLALTLAEPAVTVTAPPTATTTTWGGHSQRVDWVDAATVTAPTTFTIAAPDLATDPATATASPRDVILAHARIERAFDVLGLSEGERERERAHAHALLRWGVAVDAVVRRVYEGGPVELDDAEGDAASDGPDGQDVRGFDH